MRILGVVLFVVYCSVLSYGQTITGYVLDKESGECLIGATVYDVSTFKGTTSNRYGYFSLTVTDTATIVCRYVGY
ncbi:MAG: carboxypeptidase-like regulatory domain-containing protein [Prolixibacteraceae bacterium]|jgi:uncharacterized membrane protein YadS|nr:carboxypeptidase-like regulatory domain-containing protein [Prolixibacteraceae bacterium]